MRGGGEERWEMRKREKGGGRQGRGEEGEEEGKRQLLAIT